MGVTERKVNVPDILEVVSKFYNIEPNDIIGRKRKRAIVQARQVVMYLAKEPH